MIFDRMIQDGFEQVVFCNDSSVGLKAIISMHSTVLGPAVGGCRMWSYESEAEALHDAVRRNDTSALFRSSIGGSALNGPFVSAPSDPAPVVDGDLPVMDEMNSMNSSGSGR